MAHSSRRKYVALLALVCSMTSRVDARRGRGGGGGGGSTINSDPNLDLSGPDMAVFSIMVAFAILTSLQFLGSLTLLMKPKRPEQAFPRRAPFGTLILLSTAALTAYDAVWAWLWAYLHKQGGIYIITVPPFSKLNASYAFLSSSISYLNAAYASLDVLPLLANVGIFLAFFILLRQRRNTLLADYAAGSHQSPGVQTAKSPLYKVVPIVLFGMMIVTAVVRFALLATPREFQNPSMADVHYQKAYDAMRCLYLAFYILLTILVTIMASMLWKQVKQVGSLAHFHYDQYVLSRIVKLVMPALAVKTAYDLCALVVSLQMVSVFVDYISWIGFIMSHHIILGVLNFWIFYIALGLGTPPKSKEGENQEKAAP